MKIIKIYCDRCGAEIEGNPFRFYISEIDRESEAAVSGKNICRDFCRSCISIISQDIMDAMVLEDTAQDPVPVQVDETDPDTESSAESSAEPEPEPEQKIHKGGCVKGQRILSPARKDIVSQMVLEKRTDREIAEATDMPVDKITAYIERNGLRQLFVHDEPKKPDPPVRTTSSGMVFSE